MLNSKIFNAIYLSDIKLIHKINKYGFILNIRDYEGNNPLHYTIKNNDKNTVVTLLGYCISLIVVKNELGKAPVDLAAEDKHDILKLLISLT